MTYLPDSKRILLLKLIVFCVPVLLYLKSVTFGFTDFDDKGLILNHSAYLSDFRNVINAFLTDAFIDKTSVFYRPLQTLTYMIDIQLSGKINVAMFHFTNVLLLGFISYSIFLVLGACLVPPVLAALASLVYCMHPLFISSVAWIPARGDLLLTLFALLSFIFLLNFANKRSPATLFLHWFTFSLALFCKETAAFLPFVYTVYLLSTVGYKALKTRYPLLLTGYLFTGLIWYGLRSQSVFTTPSANAPTGVKAIVANIRIIPESLASFILPFNIAPIPYFSNAKTIIGIAIIMVIAAVFILKRENRAINLFCISWYLFLLFPSLLFKHNLIDYLNHRFLLPLIGILIFFLVNIPRRWLEFDAVINGIALSLLTILGYTTFTASSAYKGPMDFYNSALTLNPGSALAYNNRGFIKVNENDMHGAIDDFNRAIQIHSEYEEAFCNRGIAKLQAGDQAGSIADFNNAISINSSFSMPYYHRGRAYYELHDYRRALADFSSYTSMTKEHIDEYNYIGKSMSQLGNFQEAVSNFSKAISVNPDQQQSYVNRAIARFYVKDYAGVIKDCDKALAMKPGDSTALNLKAKALLISSSSITFQ
jgi:tetratricopeptide (TPR) repeat protein